MITAVQPLWRNLSKEERLLLACGRKDLSKEQEHTLLEIAHEPLNWDSLVKKAAIHGVETLLYHHLQSHGISHMPPEVRDYLRKRYMFVTLKNTLFYEEINEVINTFEMSDIPVILLKGAFLAAVVYEDIGLRPMSDIDILIKVEDLGCVERNLSALGFRRPTKRGLWVEDWDKDCDLVFIHHLPLIRQGGVHSITLELHWDLISPQYGYIFRIDTDEVWADAVPFSIDALSALTLGPEHTLLYLCLHAYNHFVRSGVVRIRFLTDLAETLQHYGSRIDWSKFTDICYGARAVRPVAGLFFLSKEFLDAPVPKRILVPLINDANLSQGQKVNFIKSMWLPSRDFREKGSFRVFCIRMSRLYGRSEKLNWFIGTLFPKGQFSRYYFPRRPDYAFRHIYKLLRFSLKAIAKVFTG